MSLINKLVFSLSGLLLLSPTILSCSTRSKEYTYLKVLNSEDYIYKHDAEKGFNNPDLTKQFEDYMLSKGQKVKVVYDTFDTMENMFNTLKTGKTQYDLVCASEYMVQKLYKQEEPLIQPLDFNKIPNYKNYESPFIKKELESIKLGDKTLNDFSVCYMWGTLGIIYNPKFEIYKSRELTEKIFNDIKSYNILWDSNYKKTISIKDSMRDTYAIGLIHKYQDELNKASKEDRQKIFDRGGEDDPDYIKHINEIKDEILKLRENIFGFEVDSGKEDIVTGKIGIDTAWSGDAVYSINQSQKEQNINLYYSLPDEGANLWFDCWSMQKDANQELSYEFLNFICDPKNAIQNMDYIGYTSSIASDETFNYFNDLYRNNAENVDPVPYDLSYFFSKDETEFIINANPSYINRQLSAQFPSKDYIDRLMIMKDYGTHNDDILKMWSEVKHEYLPTWAVILFIIEGVAIIGGITALIVTKKLNKNRRKKRRDLSTQK